MPEHSIEPELTDGNIYSLELWSLVGDQVRVDFGQVIALDLAAISAVFRELGVEDSWWQLEKMKLIFRHIYKEKKEKKK